MDVNLFFLANLAVIAFIAVLMLMPVMRRFAIDRGFVDLPGGRKDHEDGTPPIGGLVILPVFLLLSLFGGMDIAAQWPLFAGVLLLLLTGALDDCRDIRASLKFFIQFVAAILVVLPGGAVIETLGNFLGFGTVWMGLFAVPFTVFCVMLLINAINMIDGLDGLAGGKSFIILLWLGIASGTTGNGESLPFLAMLMGALAGFLFYNMRSPVNKRAKVFLGDSGSMALGLILAWYCIHMSQGEGAVLAPISVAWIVAIPVIDAFGLFVLRMAKGRHPFSADRRHFHHHFVHAGFPVGHSTFAILLIGYALGLIGYGGILIGIPEYVLTYLWILLLALHTCITVRSEKFIAFLAAVRLGKKSE